MSQSIADDAPPPCPVAMGEVIDGKYRIDQALAFGGMGVVCAATHVELETRVAIKLVRPELASNADATTRFLNEAKAAATLKGEHVSRVIDFGTLPSGSPYMVMEYLHGSDLWSLVANQGPLPAVTSVDYVLQACEALAEAHAARIIHRDIKPENLFLTERPDGTCSIKVLDFGISKQLEAVDRALTNPNNGLGSPYYMSPEQMCTPSEVDARTDIWSIGCVLYVLLTGQLPFYCESIAAVCAKVLNERPPPLRNVRPDVSPELEGIVFRCLQKERAMRFQDVAELVTALAPHGSGDAQPCITRVQRILARSSEPPSRDPGHTPLPLINYPPPAVVNAGAIHTPEPHALADMEPVTVPRLVGVVQTPIPVMPVPLMRRRLPSRRRRPSAHAAPPPRSRAWRHVAVVALAALAGGGAIVGARALGYELPHIGGALAPFFSGTDVHVRGAQAARVTSVTPAGISAPAAPEPEPQPALADTSRAPAANDRVAARQIALAATGPNGIAPAAGDSRFPTVPALTRRYRKAHPPSPAPAPSVAEEVAAETVEPAPQKQDYRKNLSALRPGSNDIGPLVPDVIVPEEWK
ncbi:MAG TPA: serine/threonine-protein kinase [Polyangiaceae bacterium]